MVRQARLVVPGWPHHITQRGNRRQKTFIHKRDYERYLTLIAHSCKHAGVEVWAYCLMPNHVHLIAVPRTPDALSLAIGQAHWHYSQMINFREGWKGHLWQSRFSSFVMDKPHLLNAARYIELNPVRAGLATRPQDWPFSSASAHMKGTDDRLVRVNPLLDLAGDWWTWITSAAGDKELDSFRLHSQNGRPLGDKHFIERLEELTGRTIASQRPGRPKLKEQLKNGGCP